MLINYSTGRAIRRATDAERAESRKAPARSRSGDGLIMVDGVTCYVDDRD